MHTRAVALGILAAMAAGAASAQERVYRLEEIGASEIPIEQSEGFSSAEQLNAAVFAANRRAEQREVADRTAWQERTQAMEQAYAADLERHRAALAAAQAQQATVDARYEAQKRAYEAELEAYRQAEAAYQAALADHRACLAGVQSRCPL